MDIDCEMNRQFAKRLRRQQLCSPKSVVLRETVNTTPIQAQADSVMSCDAGELYKPSTESLQELSARKSHVQRWLFPPTDNTPPPSQEEKQPDLTLDLDLENALSESPCTSPCATHQKVQILEERLRMPVVAPPPLFKMSNCNTINVSADRYIPARSPNNWHTRFSMIPDGRALGSSSKKSRDATAGEGSRDSLAYSCLLRNELLGANIGAVKGPCDERRTISSPERKNFFHDYATVVTVNKLYFRLYEDFSEIMLDMETEKVIEDNLNNSPQFSPMTILYDPARKKEPSGTPQFTSERETCLKYFERWSEQDQIEFVEHLLSRMCHYQHGHINTYLKPMLQRDFISLLPKKGLDHVAESILSFLDADSLCYAELVCKEWFRVISEGMLWKKLIERKVRTDSLWRGLAEKRGWIQFLFKPKPGKQHPNHNFYRTLYPKIIQDIESIENNWRSGQHVLQRINCRSENSKGVYCLQYDDQKIVSGLRDNTIKIWDRNSLQCVKVLTGHTGSVLCLQYDDKVIISGSSDSTVRVWDVVTGEMVNTLIHHCEAVLHLRFSNGMMVTCSKDRSIAVWDMSSQTEITLRRVLVGHRAAVNVVDFDEKYIVSASGDRTIKVWNTSSCEFVRTLNGHKRGIACLQYRDRLVVSGSSDNTIRLWDIECGACLRILEGHEELVRCIRFDSKRIVSGAYDGKIKVWNLVAALDPRTPANALCLRTLVEHTGRVFRLQFDEFQIVSSSHDDTILIWDFLNHSVNMVNDNACPMLGTSQSQTLTMVREM